MPCCCLLPGCPECWGDVDDVAASKADEEKPPLGGTGKSFTIQERKLVARVDKQTLGRTFVALLSLLHPNSETMP